MLVRRGSLPLRFALAVGLALPMCVGQLSVQASGTAAGCAHVHDLGHGWTVADSPALPSTPLGGSTVTTATTVAGHPNVLLATDGSAILRSADAGCTWTTAYAVPPADHPYPTEGAYVITWIFGPSGTPATGAQPTTYAVLGAAESAVPMQLLVSHDDGATWNLVVPTPSTQGSLPVYCSSQSPPTVALVAAARPQDIYLYCPAAIDNVEETQQQESSSTRDLIHVSHDGGVSWSNIKVPTTPTDITTLPGALAVDPLNPQVLWWGAMDATNRLPVLFRSSDAGATWKSVPNPAVRNDAFTHVSSIAVGKQGSNTLVAVSVGLTTYESVDSGKHWVALSPPPPPYVPARATFALWFVGATLYIARQTYAIGDDECGAKGAVGGVRIYRYRTPAGAGVAMPSAAVGRWGQWGGGYGNFVSTAGSTVTGQAFYPLVGGCPTLGIASFQAPK